MVLSNKDKEYTCIGLKWCFCINLRHLEWELYDWPMLLALGACSFIDGTTFSRVSDLKIVYCYSYTRDIWSYLNIFNCHVNKENAIWLTKHWSTYIYYHAHQKINGLSPENLIGAVHVVSVIFLCDCISEKRGKMLMH